MPYGKLELSYDTLNLGAAASSTSPSKIPNLWQRLYINTYGGGVALAWDVQAFKLLSINNEFIQLKVPILLGQWYSHLC